MKLIITFTFVLVWQSFAAAQVPVRFLEINIQYGGQGTDGATDLTRTANAIYNNNGLNPSSYKGGVSYPDVVSAIEVLGINTPTQNNSNCTTCTSNAFKLAKTLQQLTGRVWNYYEVPKFHNYYCKASGTTTTVANGEGVAILSPWPLSNVNYSYMNADVCAHVMPIAHATVTVTKSGITKSFNYFATHWDWVDEAGRQLQAVESLAFMKSYSEPKILSGDFNANQTDTSIQLLMSGNNGQYEKYLDSFNQVFNSVTALDCGSVVVTTPICQNESCGYSNSTSINVPCKSSGLPYIRTRKSRVDKIFYSAGSTTITPVDSFVPDSVKPNTMSLVVEKIGTSDDHGVRHSDHNMFFSDLKFY